MIASELALTKDSYYIASAKREYLRMQRGKYAFDICAAPFGNGFFVSWWFTSTTK